MKEIINEITEGINTFENLKHKYPKMKTQDVIDLLVRLKEQIIKTQ
jgi:hypothetical protein